MARRVQWRDSCRRVLRQAPVTGSATAAIRSCRRRVPETTGSHACNRRPSRRLRRGEVVRAEGATLTHPPRILVLHGSLRETPFSRKLANEMAGS